MTPPRTLAELIEALTVLPSLDPEQRARACPDLHKAATSILAQVRADAMSEAVAGGVSQAELARRLGVSRWMVGKVLKGER